MAPIKRFGSRCLRLAAEDAVPGDRETQELLDELWRVLAGDGGVGLAAPQIGVSRRVIVIRDPQRPRDEQRIDLVNPVIHEAFGPEVPFEEGCLSFPGLYTTICRPKGVQLSYHDFAGTPHQVRDDRLLARIAQHEIDHLDGVLFIDHLSRWQKFFLGPKLMLIVLGRLLGEMRIRK